MAITILIVDDDKLLVDKLEETVNWSKIGIDMVFTANNIRQAQKLLEEYPIEMLLCDIDMPQGNGLELLEWIRYKKLDIECAFLSSYANFAYAQMALKLSSREYLLKPISNTDLEIALLRLVEIVKEKQQKTKAQENTEQKEKKLWEDLLIQCMQEEYWIEQAKKKYDDPEEKFCLIQLRVLEIPSKEYYKKEISLENFVIENVTTEFFETRGRRVEAIVHASDLEWAIVLRNVIRNAGDEEKLEEWRKCLSGAVPARFCTYMGKPVTLEEIPKSRDKLEEIEKYAVPDETGILYEDRWYFVEREYQKPSWKTYLAEMEQTDSVQQVRKSLQGYITQRRAAGGMRKDFTVRFIGELVQTVYGYLKDRGIAFEQIFEREEFEHRRREACLSVVGSREFIEYLFAVLEGQKKSETHSDNVVDQLKKYIEQNLGEDLSRPVLAGKVFLSEDYVSKLFMKTRECRCQIISPSAELNGQKNICAHHPCRLAKLRWKSGTEIFPISVKRSGSWLDVRQMNTGAVRNNKKMVSITKKRDR